MLHCSFAKLLSHTNTPSLQELCENYQKKVSAMPPARYLGLLTDSPAPPTLVEEHFKYICHFCLVKLGDIARYVLLLLHNVII